ICLLLLFSYVPASFNREKFAGQPFGAVLPSDDEGVVVVVIVAVVAVVTVGGGYSLPPVSRRWRRAHFESRLVRARSRRSLVAAARPRATQTHCEHIGHSVSTTVDCQSSIAGLNVPNVDVFHPCNLSITSIMETQTEMPGNTTMGSTLLDEELRRILLEREQECMRRKAANTTLPPEPYCRLTFDGWSCWPNTPAGSTAYTECPDFITGFDASRKYMLIVVAMQYS
ncbi:uncharacterized protein LOC112552219, partial [Pogonomyrmex barbatus]|uniref:Uncharacterized protein LOC112552219 n=1 Tax=Pogonomyrmex barbatus TaxID=144034 RepID=A0A8N1S475_9HYME